MKAVINAKIITDKAIIENHALLFSNVIEKIMPLQEVASCKNLEIIDAKGNFLSAGFIDIHVHGCAGADTMDSASSSIDKIRQNLVKTGVTSFLPTTMTMSFEKIRQALENVRHSLKNTRSTGATVLGCHLEGPFISSAYKGAQDETYILKPDYHLIAPFADIIKIVTIAPETAASKQFISQCRKNQIVVSLGHSAATYEEATEAILAGASHITHTFNAMPPLDHRRPGIVGAAFDNSGVTCELIADNLHVHPAIQRMLLANKGVEKIILISDAMRAGLLGEGEYELGGQRVLVKDGAARLANGVLAGSVLTLNQAVYNFMVNTKINLIDAVKLATLNPAKRIGAERCKGSVAVGKDADLTIFDNKINIFATMVGGDLVYARENIQLQRRNGCV